MAITEQSKVDHIELNGDGTVLVRRKDFSVIGSVEVFIGHHSRLITPDDDISGEASEENWWLTPEVKTVCLEYFTKEMRERWAQSKDRVTEIR
tara:strand:- start:61 stop:339 length:279 start_codon:yes stop_codon:yes gene_type:complete